MRKSRVTAAAFLCAVCLLGAASAGAADFLSGTEDVPLMAGLTEQSDGTVVFDTAAGRIVEVTAAGAATAGEVRAFYGETLPHLGWTGGGDGAVWRREGEELRLQFPRPGVVHFVLAPSTP